MFKSQWGSSIFFQYFFNIYTYSICIFIYLSVFNVNLEGLLWLPAVTFFLYKTLYPPS